MLQWTALFVSVWCRSGLWFASVVTWPACLPKSSLKWFAADISLALASLLRKDYAPCKTCPYAFPLRKWNFVDVDVTDFLLENNTRAQTREWSSRLRLNIVTPNPDLLLENVATGKESLERPQQEDKSFWICSFLTIVWHQLIFNPTAVERIKCGREKIKSKPDISFISKFSVHLQGLKNG